LSPSVWSNLIGPVRLVKGTPQLRWNFAVSLSFSTLSTAFNYFAMRRGTLIVGDQRRTFFHDLIMLPALFVAFVTMVVRAARRRFFTRGPAISLL